MYRMTHPSGNPNRTGLTDKIGAHPSWPATLPIDVPLPGPWVRHNPRPVAIADGAEERRDDVVLARLGVVVLTVRNWSAAGWTAVYENELDHR